MERLVVFVSSSCLLDVVFVSSAAPVEFLRVYVSRQTYLFEISAMVLVYVLLAWFVGFCLDALLKDNVYCL